MPPSLEDFYSVQHDEYEKGQGMKIFLFIQKLET